jgi:hypothetical protein
MQHQTYSKAIIPRVVYTDMIRMGLSQSKSREGSAAQTEQDGLQMTRLCISLIL